MKLSVHSHIRIRCLNLVRLNTRRPETGQTLDQHVQMRSAARAREHAHALSSEHNQDRKFRRCSLRLLNRI